MKLMKLLPALLAALLLLAGCGGSDSPAGEAESRAQRITREARAVQESAEKLRGQNDILVERFNRLAPIEVQERLDQQAKELRELEASLDSLLKTLKGEGGATPAVAAATEEGSGLFSTLLLVLVVILALYIIFRLISSRSDFEEEDDFEDWEDDENLGFDDDLEDEFVDEDDEDDNGDDAGGDGDEKK